MSEQLWDDAARQHREDEARRTKRARTDFEARLRPDFGDLADKVSVVMVGFGDEEGDR